MPNDPSGAELSINGVRYSIVSDSLIAGEKRAIKREFRETNVKDPARIRSAEWDIWGPAGRSYESISKALAIDYVQELETRFPRRLISAGARTAVTLTGQDPTGATGLDLMDGFLMDAIDTKMDSGQVATNVTAFDEQGGYLFPHRGIVSTQVKLADWSVPAAAVQPAPVLGATSWRGKGRVAVGPSSPMQTRTGVSATGATYANTTSTSPAASVYANAIISGSDRCWIVQGDPNGTNNNLATYCLDAFLNMAATFQVGDPNTGMTGIGTLGPFTYFGTQGGNYSFTDQGKPVPTSRALRGHLSPNNGLQFADPGWGWLYYIADTGLRATSGSIDNPVGIGEQMREFTGHGGRPTAIWAERGELFVAYLYAGNTYLYRCTFSTKQAEGSYGARTAATGQFDMYPMHYLAGVECDAIVSTNTPTNPAIAWGEGTNMAYETIDRLGRDDLFASRVYSTGGGTAYLTMMDRDPQLLKTLRLARINAVNMAGSSSWVVAFSFDGGAYVSLAGAVAGFNVSRPVSGSGPTRAPLTNISGRTIKPRITQTADPSATAVPPELNGTLEIEYDERPPRIEQVTVVIDITGTGYSSNLVWDNLYNLLNDSQNGPFEIHLPNDIPPIGAYTKRYGMISKVSQRHDIKSGPSGALIEAVECEIQMWDVGANPAE